MSRGLSFDFINNLKTGLLSPILARVIADSTLCLEIRDDAINIYYRGGNLLRLGRVPAGYLATFDENYFGASDRPASALPPLIKQSSDITIWLAALPLLKQAIDLFKTSRDEREAQQLIVQENNRRGNARSTDFYLCDIEYASSHGRFDLVAVHWPSKPAERKRPERRRLVIGEVKYADSALDGSAGLHAHIEDINRYLSNPTDVSALKSEMIKVFNQKRELGLIDCEKDLVSFSDELPLLLLLFVNHDPDKSRLRALLQTLPPSPQVELRIATASMLGYGLFDALLKTPAEAGFSCP